MIYLLLLSEDRCSGFISLALLSVFILCSGLLGFISLDRESKGDRFEESSTLKK
ncbi:MAG: hypothetical protein ACW967_06485 [Candidatus Hodarchaeales archaeon]